MDLQSSSHLILVHDPSETPSSLPTTKPHSRHYRHKKLCCCLPRSKLSWKACLLAWHYLIMRVQQEWLLLAACHNWGKDTFFKLLIQCFRGASLQLVQGSDQGVISAKRLCILLEMWRGGFDSLSLHPHPHCFFLNLLTRGPDLKSGYNKLGGGDPNAAW